MATQIYTQYWQGLGNAETLEYGIVTVGQVYTPRQFASTGLPWGTLNTAYTVTAVSRDPNGNANVLAEYPGDTVTLSGGIGVVAANTFTSAYRLS